MNEIISGDTYHRIYSKGVEDGARTTLDALREFIDSADIEIKNIIKKHETVNKKGDK